MILVRRIVEVSLIQGFRIEDFSVYGVIPAASSISRAVFSSACLVCLLRFPASWEQWGQVAVWKRSDV